MSKDRVEKEESTLVRNFRLNLARIIEERKLMVTQVAAMMGSTHPVVSDHLRGRNSPTLSMVAKIASALGVDPLALLIPTDYKPVDRARKRKATKKKSKED